MKLLPSLLKNTTTEPRSSSSSSSSWSWPYCHQPKTLSFRHYHHHNIFRTINSAYVDSTLEPPTQSLCANSSDAAGDPIETLIRGLRSSDRLFFDPDQTSSILESKPPPPVEAVATSSFTLMDSVALSMESRDPYLDFRKSMEEMVEAHAVKDWEDLEELLYWYLRVNVKTNHPFILAAFVDFLFASASSFSNSDSISISTNSHSPSSPLSFYTSSLSSSFNTPCASSTLLEAHNQVIKHQQDEASSSTSTL